MKPFSLKEVESGKKVITRDGHDVSILYISKNKCDGSYPIFSLLTKNLEKDKLCHHTETGKFYSGEKHPYDLFIKEEDELQNIDNLNMKYEISGCKNKDSEENIDFGFMPEQFKPSKEVLDYLYKKIRWIEKKLTHRLDIIDKELADRKELFNKLDSLMKFLKY